MRIAIFGNTRKNIIPQLKSVLSFFKDKPAFFLFEKELFELVASSLNFNNSTVETINDENFTADLALSIGGDGTFLKTASYIQSKEIPILGINVGRLGFLTDVQEKEIALVLQKFLAGEYKIESRSLLEISTSDDSSIGYPVVLNDLAVLKQESSSMIVIRTKINGEFIHSYQADGLIISTPTGSTAYSMSVGGPIVVPQADILIISPIASHSLNVRPIIIPDSWEIELEIASRTQSFLIALDGRSYALNETTRVKIKKANYYVKVLKVENYSFFKTLSKKLLWGKDLRT